MPTNIFIKTADNTLRPCHEDGEQWLRGKKVGKQFKANMKSTRNPDHHRKGFALLNLVLKNHPTYDNMDDLLVEFKLRSGHYVEHIRPGNSKSGNELRAAISKHIDAHDLHSHLLQLVDNLEREAKLIYIPKSIAFDEMGQEEFEELYEKWIRVGCQMIGVEDDELRKEIAGF